MSAEEKVVLVLGDKGVGKSSFLERLTTGNYREDQDFSSELSGEVEADLRGRKLKFREVGQERESKLPETCLGVLILFDLTTPSSLSSVPYYLKKVKDKFGPSVPLVVCGTKFDLLSRKGRKVGRILRLIQKYQVKYWDLSAVSLYNLEKPFNYLASVLPSD